MLNVGTNATTAGVTNMTQRNPSPTELQEVVRKIHALRRVTKTTGFFTSKLIVDLLSKLTADDLIAIGEALQLKPREMPEKDKKQQPSYTRPEGSRVK